MQLLQLYTQCARSAPISALSAPKPLEAENVSPCLSVYYLIKEAAKEGKNKEECLNGCTTYYVNIINPEPQWYRLSYKDNTADVE